jgi:hypothetical protein
MRRAPQRRPLTKGLDVLAKAAGYAAGRGATRSRRIVLGRPSAALGKDEILIAVADATSIALTLVKVPGRLARGGRADDARLDEMARRIAEIDMVAGEITGPPGTAAGAPPPLTKEEERLLRAGKLEPRPLGPGEAPLLHRATAEYARLLADSYSVEEAAAVLGVNGSRIRQRLTATPISLYGIKLGKAWRIPKFQFHGRRLVPGLEAVLSRIPANLHPVALYRWLTSPSVDLTADEKPISPLDWLRIGNPPDTVADLAASL